jgi:phosphoglycerol transferase
MLNAVAGADVLLASFIRQVRQSPIGANTVVVLASDHLAMTSTATPLFAGARRRNLLMIFPPGLSKGVHVDTPGTTLDIASTLLPFIGLEGAVGLGKDLSDSSISPTVRHTVVEGCNQGWWTRELLAAWDFPRFNGILEVDPQKKCMRMDGRTFSLPVLITLTDERRAMLSFVGDSQISLESQALNAQEPFVLIVPNWKVSALLSSVDNKFGGWCLVTGKGGRFYRVIPMPMKGQSSFQTSGLLAEEPVSVQ